MRNRRPALALWLLACVACRDRSAAQPPLIPLHGDVARAGSVTIPASLVEGVARARGVRTREALDGLLADALLAQAATAVGLDRESTAGWASTAAVARIVPERLMVAARARGQPSDEELANVRVVHAVVLRSPTLARARAFAIASAILQAVTGARDDADFEARSGKVPHVGTRVTVERLPAFDASGRTIEGADIDPTFVAAALALRASANTSDVVETPFGWHVIRLVERLAPPAQELERRRLELADAVLQLRVRADLLAILQAERRRLAVEVSPAADQLLAEATASLQ